MALSNLNQVPGQQPSIALPRDLPTAQSAQRAQWCRAGIHATRPERSGCLRVVGSKGSHSTYICIHVHIHSNYVVCTYIYRMNISMYIKESSIYII